MESITLKINQEYTANIKYEMNGSLDVKRIKVKPDLSSSDVNYSCDVTIPEGKTIISESILLEYFEFCKIADIKIFDKFVSAILNRKLHGW